MFYELFYEVDIPAKSFVESEYGYSLRPPVHMRSKKKP